MKHTRAISLRSGPVKAAKRSSETAATGGIIRYYLYRDQRAGSRSYSPQQVIKIVSHGLPFQELEALRASLGLSLEKLAPRIGLPKASLYRRKSADRLKPEESDKVVRFARLVGQAVNVLGGEDAARKWLNKSQVGLGGAVPLDYAETEVGAREVENLLGRIEYGVYS